MKIPGLGEQESGSPEKPRGMVSGPAVGRSFQKEHLTGLVPACGRHLAMWGAWPCHLL